MILPYPETVLRLGELHRADLLREAEEQRLRVAATEKNEGRGLAGLAGRMLRSVHHRDDTPSEGGARGDGRRRPALGATHP
jgi:hypothetical protein